ncbi:hypothetical protein [Halomonas sp. NO4]|uniref:hypothetical protein n=1 Tax=Halomonas sp. NO4 TaxID=2484813 RepID=UPI0013D6005A|nr:hypothetical protein [Halomonas sp. NO4]
MATLDELVDNVVMEVPDAPLMTIRDMLRWAGRRLCTEADVWVERDGPIVAGADTDYPEVIVPAGAEALRIRELKTDDDFTYELGVHFTQPTPSTVAFEIDPSDSLLYGELAVRPQPGKTPPESVMERYYEALCDGARSRLFLLPQPWQNADLATLYQRRFQAAITEAKQHAQLGHARGTRRVKARRFI